MKLNVVLILLFIVIYLPSTFAQLVGIKNIPGDYPNLASAISSLNSSGVGTGGVSFNIAAGYTETFASVSSGIIAVSGTGANPIVFRKYGSGANPVITAAHAGTGTLDGIIVMKGTDYITFDGISLLENVLNTSDVERMEWGFALLKASSSAPFNGCQHVVIKNADIQLNKINYRATGIYAGNHTILSDSQLTITSADDANSYCNFSNNSISNVYKGISLNGFADGAPYTLLDMSNEVGTDGGNSLTDFGGNSVEISVIQAVNQDKIIIANNIINGGGSYNMLMGINVKRGQNTFSQIYNNTITLAGWYNVYPISDSLPSYYPYGTVNIHNNTIINCNSTASVTGDFIGIVQAGGNQVNIYGNTISNNIHHSGSWYGNNFNGINCYYWANNVDIYSNVISDNILTGGGIMGCIVYESSDAKVHNNGIHHNSITDPYGSGFAHAYLYGIVQGMGTTVDCYNNEIHDLYVDNTYAASEGFVSGIFDNGSTYSLKKIHHNTIYNISGSLSATAPITLYGIKLTSDNFLETYNNNISNITNAAVNGKSYGMYIKECYTAYIYNNSLSGIYTPNAQGAQPTVGMYFENGWANPQLYVYYNTIYLDASSSTSGDFGSSAVYAHSNLKLEMKNNIFDNVSVSKGAGKTVAYRRSDNILTYYSFWSGYNDYHAGTPGADNLIFSDGTNSFQDIFSYTAFMQAGYTTGGGYGIREVHSFNENPPFINTATQPYNVHINPLFTTLCESGGIDVNYPVVITDDMDSQPRYPAAGYPVNPLFAAISTDVGADEFAGMPPDVIPPVISYSDLLNTTSMVARTLYAGISDASGIPVSGTGLPVLYWRVNGGTLAASTGVYESGDQYSFAFGGGVVPGDVIEYYVVAQDNVLPLPNVSSYPSDGSSGFTFNPPACTVPPSTLSFYRVLSVMCGDYTVGTGGAFTSLTGSGGFFEAVGSSVLTCDVTATIVSDISEDGSYSLSQWQEEGTGNYKITIQPNNGTLKTLSGSYSYGGLIRLFGAQRVVIDGGVSKSLLFRNSADPMYGTGATFLYGTGCVEDILTNCIIEGNAQNDYGGVITLQSWNTLNLRITGNDIRDSKADFIGSPVNAIYASVSNADSLVIKNNNIYNWTAKGIFFQSVSGKSSIAGNSLFYNLPDLPEWQQDAIYLGGSSTPGVYGNYIGGQSPLCSGAAFVHSGSSSFNGINVNLSRGGGGNTKSVDGESDPFAIVPPSAIPITIDNNVIQNIHIENSSKYSGDFFTGIRLSAGKANIGSLVGNLIGSTGTPASVSINGQGHSYGIYVDDLSDQSKIENNTISNISLTALNGSPDFTGIFTNAGLVNKNKISQAGAVNADLTPTITGISDQCGYLFNNMFSNNAIALDGGAALNPTLFGIHSSGNNFSGFYYNSVSLSGPATVSSSSYAFYSGSSSSLSINNNVFSNSRLPGGTGKHYAMVSEIVPADWNSDFNDLFAASLPLASWDGVDFDNLAAWATASTGDLNSVSVNPSFVSATDLHTMVTELDNSGTYIYGIDTDLDGVSIGDPPDMGCYQFSSGSGKTLSLKLFLEGLYTGAGTMNPALDGNTGLPKWGAGIADRINVQLHENTSPFNAVGSPKSADLLTDGTVTVTYTGTLNGNYYIAVSHRNSIETWSANPISFAGSGISYDFSNMATAAFGNNLKQDGPVFLLYGGDVNQDGIIDDFDLNLIDLETSIFGSGYLSEDINGDGIVDAMDLIIPDNNSAQFILVARP